MANNHRNSVGGTVTIIDEKPAAEPTLYDGLLSSPGKIGVAFALSRHPGLDPGSLAVVRRR